MTTDNLFTRALADSDPLVFDALGKEASRQRDQLELIASENIVSRAVLQTLGHQITNKTLEGYPGKRFHGGGENMDIVEQAAIDRARELFDCEYVNVQPHSGTQANQAVFFTLLKPGDRVLSLDLAAGGHLSHGAPPNLSGRWFEAHHYKVDRKSGRIDYAVVEEQAKALKPALLITGGSAYPREIDFPRLAQIAESVGAKFLVDMAHFAGLVAAGVHPSPLPHADFVTCTTTKTMRGPRGGLILSRSSEFEKRLNSAVFPGVQGSLHSQVIAAKAVCLGEALQPEFKQYGLQMKNNAVCLAKTLMERQIGVISGGTDTHLVLLNLSGVGLNGQQAQDALVNINVTSNKNPIPFDSPKPSEWLGLRLGVGAITTRGLREDDVVQMANQIADVLHAVDGDNWSSVCAAGTAKVADICQRFPVY
ncbi:MAG: glycine hydroxymethyltransferase [Parasphingorhabdus sp.]|jgi:glycine hydroxymethyltransferase